MADYVIRGGQEGRARLSLIGDALRPSTDAVLDAAGLRIGMRCVDLGCGGGDVTMHLARAVGPRGAVVGVDMDAVKIEIARAEADEEGLGNVEFRVGDAAAFDADAEYDLAYARLLLTHLADPQATLTRMVDAVRPGGVVVVEDMQHSAVFAHPPCPAVDRYLALYDEVVRVRGGDPDIGPALPAMFRQAGLGEIGLHLAQPAFLAGAAKRIHLSTLENVAAALLSTGVATAEEIAWVADGMGVCADAPSSIVGFPRVFGVHGHRPHADPL
jgi:SAM-dependent methyltransferase